MDEILEIFQDDTILCDDDVITVAFQINSFSILELYFGDLKRILLTALDRDSNFNSESSSLTSSRDDEHAMMVKPLPNIAIENCP